jgi:NAD(P)-dependent dehydrogenase (short-subunit alcohol dehydrogenase family)
LASNTRHIRIGMKLRDKVVVVTGAGSGMGRELSLDLVRRGARVAAVDINDRTLQETVSLAKGGGDAIATFALSVADRAAVGALPGQVAQRFGAADGLINCAGVIQPFVHVRALDDKAIERVFDVNWNGTLHMTRAFLPRLLERPEAHLVNISSMGGFLPVPGQSIYGASKAAVKLFTEGLHAELAGTPVRVTLVFPGAVATNITQNSGVAMPALGADQQQAFRPLAADQAAREMLDAVERNRFRVLVGKDAKAMDLLYRLAPERAAAFIAKRMGQLLEKAKG